MFKRKSFIIAIGILSIPIAIFFILSKAKQNFNQLPIFGEKYLNGNDTVYYAIKDFTVTDQLGKTITLKSLNNNIFIANFFFASCKDVCPTMNRRIKTIYDKAKEFSEVKFISFSVDPTNDTTEVLNNYAKRFEADPKIWHFTRTNTEEEMVKIGQGFLLPVSIEDKTIDHSQQLLLIDKEGRIRGIYNSADDSELYRLDDEIKVLLYEYHQPGS